MNIEMFAKMKALEAAYISGNQGFMDKILNGAQGNELRDVLKLKRLQFDTTPELFDEVESICNLLGCTKREFLEMAVCQSVNDAKKTFSETFQASTLREYGEVEAC